MTTKRNAERAGNARNLTLPEALKIIRPRRSDAASEVLTLCCFYLRTGLPMPRELRLWLDQYLLSDRRKGPGVRSMRMANLEVQLQRTRATIATTGRGKITRTQAEYSAALGLDESTVKKRRRRKDFAAVVAVATHLNQLIGLVAGKKMR